MVNMKNIQLAEGINTGALCDFIKECYADGTYIRAFQCIKDNTVLAKVAIEPYSFEEPMLVYSLSKSFTSVCVGIAQAEGLLNIEERIVDIFPDKCPEVIVENLAKMRIKDCLSMTSGHAACVFSQLQHEADPVRYFLAQPVAYEPGTTFVYSTAATYICGAAVAKRSGMSLVDYLHKKVFSKMGIEKPQWRRCADGSCHGGTGLMISSDTATKFGRMLRDGGVYNGIQIVPKEWIQTASTIHSETPRNGTADWLAGYGYQFWMNAKDGFRGDGAYGQLCMVFPKRNIVFTMLCEAANMQKEVDSIYKLLDVIEVADNSRYEELKTLSESYINQLKTVPLLKAGIIRQKRISPESVK
jgi:CubicO group peptidase (beta-lactamase class C family)